MVDHEKKAQDLISKAEKKLRTPGGLFGSVFGGSEKTDEAAELFVKAANSFKMAKNWAAAGHAFCRCATLNLKAKTPHEAASNYVDAASCYKKTKPEDAIKYLLKAIEIYKDMGRFTIAAKHLVSVGELYEAPPPNIQKAMTSYEEAADLYKGEESSSSANKCWLKVAHYAAQSEQYDRAISIYEQVATSNMDNKLLRYGAKDYFFRAALCRMCLDVQDAANSVGKYEDMFPAFGDSREAKLVKALIAACEEQDVDAYTDVVQAYNRIMCLDAWYTTLLLRVKKQIEGEPLSLR